MSASNTDVTTRSLDLAARSIDLLLVIGKTANSTDSIIRVGMEIGRWLGREKLNERDLQFCLEKARGLIIANSKGQAFYETVLSGIQRHVVGMIFSQPSGALGRLLASDPYLSWMTSTIACLYHSHREADITNTLCDFILQTQHGKDHKLLSNTELSWHPDRFQLKPVLQKIVSSVWFNVVNSGIVGSAAENGIGLPDALKTICLQGGHILSSYEFSTVLKRLHEAGDEVIIQSNYFVSDITLWLLYHFNGRLRVVVSGEILYDVKLGDYGQFIELRIHKYCDDSSEMHDVDVDGELHMYTTIAGKMEELFKASPVPLNMASESKVRQKLYSTTIQFPVGASGRESIKSLTRSTALAILRWLLKLRVTRVISRGINYIVNPRESDSGPNAERSAYRVADILYREPAMLNLGWREYNGAKVIFEKQLPSFEDSDENFDDDSDARSDTSMDTDDIRYDWISHYPILKDFLNEIGKNCQCTFCQDDDYGGQRALWRRRPGCLTSTALTEVQVLIAHGIADGFGVPDASAYSRSDLGDFGVWRILEEVASGAIKWEQWYDVAARTFLGCPSITSALEIDSDIGFKGYFSGGVAPVATQYGDIAVVATWLDLSEKLQTTGTFGFKITRGRLAVTRGDNPEKQYLQGIEGDFASISCFPTEQLSVQRQQPSQQYQSLPPPEFSNQDSLPVEVQFVLFLESEWHYKIILRATSVYHSRLIDIGSATGKTLEPPSYLQKIVSCPHKSQDLVCSLREDEDITFYSSSEMIGRWGDSLPGPTVTPQFTSQRQKNIYHISHILDSRLKFNIALALTRGSPVIVSPEGTCMGCALERARKLLKDGCKMLRESPRVPPPRDLAIPRSDVYIIRVSRNLQKATKRVTLPERAIDVK